MKKNKKNEFSLLSAEQVDFNNNLKKSKTISIDIEIERYLDFNSPVTEFSCPLDFYKKNESIFLNLKMVSKIIFATTATSVPSECLFSKASELITNRRNRLKPELAEKLLLLSC